MGIEYKENPRGQKIGIKEDLKGRGRQDTLSALGDRALNLLARIILDSIDMNKFKHNSSNFNQGAQLPFKALNPKIKVISQGTYWLIKALKNIGDLLRHPRNNGKFFMCKSQEN